MVQHVIDEEHNLDLFESMCWTIWYRRNQIRFKHSVYPISQMLLQALQDFLHALPPSAQPSVTSPPRVRWIPPPASSLKINFDGALSKTLMQQVWGWLFVIIGAGSGLDGRKCSPCPVLRWCQSNGCCQSCIFRLSVRTVISYHWGRLWNYHQSFEEWRWIIYYIWTLNFYCKIVHGCLLFDLFLILAD